jgi:hypothetical protein
MYDITFILIILLIILLLFKNKREPLANKPKPDMIPKMTQQIIENEGMFVGNLNKVKEKLPWMDAVLYEDVRNLSFKKNINTDTVSNLFKN